MELIVPELDFSSVVQSQDKNSIAEKLVYGNGLKYNKNPTLKCCRWKKIQYNLSETEFCFGEYVGSSGSNRIPIDQIISLTLNNSSDPNDSSVMVIFISNCCSWKQRTNG